MTQLKTIAIVLMTVLGSASTAFGAELRQEFLGSTHLRNIHDRDLIQVAGVCPSRVNPPVRAIQLRVHGKGAQIDHFAIQYGNGEWQQVPVRHYFARGTESRWIDLPGGARCIERIYVAGDSDGLPLHRQSRVEVWGLRVAR